MKVNGSQVDVNDFKDLTSSERVKNIIDVAEYYGYSGDRVRGLVFCSRTEEAETISELFNGIDKKESGRKYRTVALTDFDRYGEMDPLRILSYVDGALGSRKLASYHGFLVAFDDLEETLSEEENHLLEFVSQKFASGKRLNEVLMLEVLSSASESPDIRTAAGSAHNGVKMYLFVRKNKDDKESKEFYYLGRIRHEPDGLLQQFVMPNTDVSAVEIEYKLYTPVEKNLYDYLTSENV